MPSGWKWLVVVVSVLIVFALLWNQYCRDNVPPTDLEITVIGGFAFVPTLSDRHLEIAYLDDFVLRKDTNGNGEMDPDEPAIYEDTNGNGMQDANEPDTCHV